MRKKGLKSIPFTSNWCVSILTQPEGWVLHKLTCTFCAIAIENFIPRILHGVHRALNTFVQYAMNALCFFLRRLRPCFVGTVFLHILPSSSSHNFSHLTPPVV